VGVVDVEEDMLAVELDWKMLLAVESTRLVDLPVQRAWRQRGIVARGAGAYACTTTQ
jgi:hypothetical protein